MRRESAASLCLPLLAVAWAGVALASGFGVWSLSRSIAGMDRQGGGIGSLSLAMWQAARLPLASAWIAAAVTLLAIAVALRNVPDEPRPVRSWWIAGVAVAAGVAAVLAFRSAVAFIFQAVIPGHEASWGAGRSIGEAISSRLLGAGAVSAVCFAIAIALAVIAYRRGAVPLRGLVAVLVVSLSVAGILATSLSSFATHFRVMAKAGPRAAEMVSSTWP